MISLLSKKTTELTKKDKISIIKLKNSLWNYSIKSNKRWFEKYVKKIL